MRIPAFRSATRWAHRHCDALGQLVPVANSLELSENQTECNVARTINNSRRGLSLELTSNERLKAFGGARTSYDNNAVLFRIEIDPRLATGSAFKMKSSDRGNIFFASITLDEALLHEIGHFFAASGILSSAVPVNSSISDRKAIEFENDQRRLKGGPRASFERISHSVATTRDR